MTENRLSVVILSEATNLGLSKSTTSKVQRQCCRVLDALLHFDQEGNRFFSIDCAMIIAKCEIHHWVDHDLAVHGHGTRHDFMHHKNAVLRRVSNVRYEDSAK